MEWLQGERRWKIPAPSETRICTCTHLIYTTWATTTALLNLYYNLFFVRPHHRFVRPLNKGTQLSSTLSYSKKQLPYPSQVFLLFTIIFVASFFFVASQTLYAIQLPRQDSNPSLCDPLPCVKPPSNTQPTLADSLNFKPCNFLLNNKS